jgi:hypothetical protein
MGINRKVRSVGKVFSVLLQFRELTQHVGVTLVVALDWAGTRPAPPYANTSRNPKEPFFHCFSFAISASFVVK